MGMWLWHDDIFKSNGKILHKSYAWYPNNANSTCHTQTPQKKCKNLMKNLWPAKPTKSCKKIIAKLEVCVYSISCSQILEVRHQVYRNSRGRACSWWKHARTENRNKNHTSLSRNAKDRDRPSTHIDLYYILNHSICNMSGIFIAYISWEVDLTSLFYNLIY
jgi:hypothetical protein